MLPRDEKTFPLCLHQYSWNWIPFGRIADLEIGRCCQQHRTTSPASSLNYKYKWGVEREFKMQRRFNLSRQIQDGLNGQLQSKLNLINIGFWISTEFCNHPNISLWLDLVRPVPSGGIGVWIFAWFNFSGNRLKFVYKIRISWAHFPKLHFGINTFSRETDTVEIWKYYEATNLTTHRGRCCAAHS